MKFELSKPTSYHFEVVFPYSSVIKSKASVSRKSNKYLKALSVYMKSSAHSLRIIFIISSAFKGISSLVKRHVRTMICSVLIIPHMYCSRIARKIERIILVPNIVFKVLSVVSTIFFTSLT